MVVVASLYTAILTLCVCVVVPWWCDDYRNSPSIIQPFKPALTFAMRDRPPTFFRDGMDEGEGHGGPWCLGLQ